MTRSVPEWIGRFNEKVSPEPMSGCWLWTAASNGTYGKFWLNGKYEYAHRVSYEMHFGAIPDDKEIDHLCRVTLCVNPDHLEAVLHRENCLRGESFSAKHAVKTHCPQGHQYDVENTRYHGGKRHCKKCQRDAGIRWRAKQ